MAKITYARLRVLQAIQRTGCPPSNCRALTLQGMQDAGLIAPLSAPKGSRERWFITRAGQKAIEAAEAAEGWSKVNGLLGNLLG